MARRPRRQTEIAHTRVALLEGAADALATRGVHRATLGDIAKACKCTPPTLYATSTARNYSPEKWITYDAAKLMADTAPALAETLIPERLSRIITRAGGDPVKFAHRVVRILGMDDPPGARGPKERLAALKGRFTSRGVE